jgi:hypothetical protein
MRSTTSIAPSPIDDTVCFTDFIMAVYSADHAPTESARRALVPHRARAHGSTTVDARLLENVVETLNASIHDT